MFTGIIREIGTVVKRHAQGGVVTLSVAAPHTAAVVQPLESVAINGVCLTAVRVRAGVMRFEMIPETQRLTSLGALREGARVHLEPSLSLTDRLHGHVVLGHIDGQGTITQVKMLRGERVLTVRVPAALRCGLVPKGPVAVDGVSLTVGPRLTAKTFMLHLIPETLRRTLLGERRAGETVNVEVDYLAKVAAQAARRTARRTARFRSSRALC